LGLLARNPEILICWSGGRLLVEDLREDRETFVSVETILLLDLFERPRSAEAAARALPEFDRSSVLRSIRQLVRLGLLIPSKEARRRRSRIGAWRENLASALYHVAARDVVFMRSPSAIERSLRGLVARERQPRHFKRYRGRPRRKLPSRPVTDAGPPLESVLAARRTVRDFSRRALSFEDLAAVVRGTWGRTGWIDGGFLGALPLKTSPSAGARHPGEVYVLAWNVAGLSPGLYHYDVASDELRRLKSGDLRREAVEAASGQAWIRGAAFLCVMTVVFKRTLWKYEQENAYRVVWLDAGHLAQTFCLLATSRGLGPFTTAAIQDSYVEKLIGLDGIKEFPVYLCGAGVPAKKKK
jgi:SagB-type dehydrogenase family enzyme